MKPLLIPTAQLPISKYFSSKKQGILRRSDGLPKPENHQIGIFYWGAEYLLQGTYLFGNDGKLEPRLPRCQPSEKMGKATKYRAKVRLREAETKHCNTRNY